MAAIGNIATHLAAAPRILRLGDHQGPSSGTPVDHVANLSTQDAEA